MLNKSFVHHADALRDRALLLSALTAVAAAACAAACLCRLAKGGSTRA